MLEYVTCVDHCGWIDGDVAFVDVAGDAFFIDQEGGAIPKALLLVKDSVVFDDRAFEIAEDWERYSELLGKFAVGGNTVNTHSENLSLV